MDNRLFFLRNILICIFLLQPLQSRGEGNISTAAIASSAASTDCLDYSVIGLCFWLHCSWSGCSIRTSLLIKHYIPELVVSSYRNTGENPWSEIALLSPPNATAADGGATTNSDVSVQSNLIFKNTDVIGHPGSLVFDALASSFGFTCASGATALWPYFLSTLDTLAWRHGVPEMAYPQALTPGVRELRKTGDLWGNIYPRSGFVTQVHDYKAAALTAQRAADVVTRTHQPHVYWPLNPSSRSGYWPPSSVREGDGDTHKWQMLHPQMTSSCRVWPDKAALDPYSSRISEEGKYVWSLWRPYECCRRRGSFIARIPS